MHVDVGRIREAKGASLTAQGRVGLGGDLGQGLSAADPAEVFVTIANTGRFLHIEGEITARLRAECVRCLAPLNFNLTIPFTQDYISGTQVSEDGETAQEFQPFTGDSLDLAPAVTEAVLLALPMKPLCRDDCPGLCPQCGRNLKEGDCGCQRRPGHPGLADLARLLPKKEV